MHDLARDNPFNLPPAFVPASVLQEESTSKSVLLQQHVRAAHLYVEDLCFFIKEWRWLLDTHPNDFFTDDPMSRLPPSWQQHYKDVPLGTANLHFLNSDGCSSSGGVHEFFYKAQRLSMPRQPYIFTEDFAPKDPASLADPAPTLHAELRQGTKDKKAHEVERLARLVECLVLAGHYQGNVIDCGAGSGYLSQ
ncbi:hypothetical protein CYMTET_10161, partial [Cymbomonas tetramitiformis]